MRKFPASMMHPANRIASGTQNTPGIEGFVFDGADGSQMAFWSCGADAQTHEHTHPFDEYFVVLEGVYWLTLDGEVLRVGPGEECFIPAGTRIAGRVEAGTRTIHHFAGRRAERAGSA